MTSLNGKKAPFAAAFPPGAGGGASGGALSGAFAGARAAAGGRGARAGRAFSGAFGGASGLAAAAAAALAALAFCGCAASAARGGACGGAEAAGAEPAAASFEAGFDGFAARGAGSAAIERVRGVSRSGRYSLLVTGREHSWNGIALDVSGLAEPFGLHEFELWAMPAAGAGPVSFRLSAEFHLRGQTVWRHFGGPLASASARPGSWTRLKGSMPFCDFDSVSVYIETDAAGAFADFFIDDAAFRHAPVEYRIGDLPSLSEAHANYFMLGTAVSPRDMRGERLEFVRRHFNAVTAGNAMKPAYLQPRPGAFHFEEADRIAQAAIDNGIAVIGHALAWHEQSPAWMNPPGISREAAIENLVSHISAVVGRYRGRVHSWDVVNEAFPSSVYGDPSDWRAHLRRTPWLDAIGSDYIEIAFRAAHAADPGAILYYNDYNLNQPGKREAVFHMARELLGRGVPIHGIGMQGHYSLSTPPRQVEESIMRFAELGVRVSITELDITVDHARGWERLTEGAELMQAVLFARLFMIFRERSDAIGRVTLWGLDDSTSWRADRFPLPFNRDLSAKKAFFAILDPEGFLREHGKL